jgi:hypothetical protein
VAYRREQREVARVSWVAVTEAVKADQASVAGLRLKRTSTGPRDVVLVSEICTDPEALEWFYREHVGAVEGFIARRVARGGEHPWGPEAAEPQPST